METLILMFDTAAVLVVVIFSLRNERRPEHTPEFGPFRLKPLQPKTAPLQAPPQAKRRRARGL